VPSYNLLPGVLGGGESRARSSIFCDREIRGVWRYPDKRLCEQSGVMSLGNRKWSHSVKHCDLETPSQKIR
jgi:hypothetical protein